MKIKTNTQSRYLLHSIIILCVFLFWPRFVDSSSEVTTIRPKEIPSATPSKNDGLKESVSVLELRVEKSENDAGGVRIRNKRRGSPTNAPRYVQNLYDQMALEMENDDRSTSGRRRRSIKGESYNLGAGGEAVNVGDVPLIVHAIAGSGFRKSDIKGVIDPHFDNANIDERCRTTTSSTTTETSTTETSTASTSTTEEQKKEKEKNIKDYWWAFLIGALALLGGVGTPLGIWYRNRRRRRRQAAADLEAASAAADVAAAAAFTEAAAAEDTAAAAADTASSDPYYKESHLIATPPTPISTMVESAASTDPNEAKALKLLQEAEKKGKGGGGFTSGSGKGEEACELYVKAANLFKMAKKWHEAGQAFVKSAELQLIQNDAKHEAASNYADAATCFRKVNAQLAADCLQKAAEIYTNIFRFTMAARQHNSIAELYETEAPDLEKAMMHYGKAGDYYKGEESKSAANKCFLKVAQFAAQLEKYRRAIDILEKMGVSSADNNLFRYSAKDYFFKAALCHLCQDVLDAKRAINRYAKLHPPFADSREHKLLKDVILAVEEKNLDAFTDAVKNYEKISRLDEWTVTMLLRVKKQCGDGDGGGGASDLL